MRVSNNDPMNCLWYWPLPFGSSYAHDASVSLEDDGSLRVALIWNGAPISLCYSIHYYSDVLFTGPPPWDVRGSHSIQFTSVLTVPYPYCDNHCAFDGHTVTVTFAEG